MSIPITVVRGVADLAGPQLTAPTEDEDGTFPLSWTYGRDDVTFSVEEATDPATLLSDTAEALSVDWGVGEPTEATIQPWQLSDSDTRKIRGNLRHGGDRSFWTGIGTTDQRPGIGPGQGSSSLTSKAVALPARRSAVLSYWSDFANDANDSARVEVAIDDGSGRALDWDTVESFGRDSKDEYTMSLDEAVTEAGARFERRSVDLSQYAGHTVRLRFSYVLGAAQYVNVLRTGWYVDDIALVTADFREAARTEATSYEITGRRAGTYLYRVRALLANGTRSGASNVEQVRVTVGRTG